MACAATKHIYQIGKSANNRWTRKLYNFSTIEQHINFLTNITLDADDQGWTQAAAIDVPGRQAFFFVAGSPSTVARLDLTSFTVTDIINLAGLSLIVDSARGYLYAGVGGVTGEIFRVSLDTLATVDSLVLDSGDYSSGQLSGVMDTNSQFLYYAGNGKKIVKIDLDTFTKVTSIAPINPAMDYCAINDNYLFTVGFSASYPDTVINKISLSDFIESGSTVYENFSGLNIFAFSDWIYVSGNTTDTFEGSCSQFKQSDLTFVATLLLPEIEEAGIYDGFTNGKFLYLNGANNAVSNQTAIARIDMEAFCIDEIKTDANTATIRKFGGSIVYDPVEQNIYYSTQITPSGVVKVNVSPTVVYP